MWHFISTGRLGKYARKEGIQQSLEIMVEYKNLPIVPAEVIRYLSENEEELLAVFRSFFAELQAFCADYSPDR